MTQELSNRFANMSFLFALVVVFLHVPSVRTPGVVFVKDFLPGFLQLTANEWFFAAAGFFFVRHADQSGWWRKGMSKRLMTLGVPYFILNILMFLLLFLYQGSHIHYPVQETNLTVWNSVLNALGLTFSDPIDGPLWFVRALLLYFLFVPVLIPILKHRKMSMMFLVILFAVNLIGWERCCLGCFPDFFARFLKDIVRPSHLFYFFAGIALSFGGFGRLPVKWAWVALLLGGALSCYAPMDVEPRHHVVLSRIAGNLSRPLIIIGLFHLVSTKVWPKVLTENAFAIYILHWQVIMAMYIICGKTHTHDFVFGNPILLLLSWFFVVSLSVLCAWMIRKSDILKGVILGGR